MAKIVLPDGRKVTIPDSVPEDQYEAFGQEVLASLGEATPTEEPTAAPVGDPIPNEWFPGTKAETTANTLSDLFSKYTAQDPQLDLGYDSGVDRSPFLSRAPLPETMRAAVPPEFTAEPTIPLTATEARQGFDTRLADIINKPEDVVGGLLRTLGPAGYIADAARSSYDNPNKTAATLGLGLDIAQLPTSLAEEASKLLPWADPRATATFDISNPARLLAGTDESSDANLIRNLTGSPYEPNPGLLEELLAGGSLAKGANVLGDVIRPAARKLSSLFNRATPPEVQTLENLLPTPTSPITPANRRVVTEFGDRYPGYITDPGTGQESIQELIGMQGRSVLSRPITGGVSEGGVSLGTGIPSRGTIEDMLDDANIYDTTRRQEIANVLRKTRHSDRGVLLQTLLDPTKDTADTVVRGADDLLTKRVYLNEPLLTTPAPLKTPEFFSSSVAIGPPPKPGKLKSKSLASELLDTLTIPDAAPPSFLDRAIDDLTDALFKLERSAVDPTYAKPSAMTPTELTKSATEAVKLPGRGVRVGSTTDPRFQLTAAKRTVPPTIKLDTTKNITTPRKSRSVSALMDEGASEVYYKNGVEVPGPTTAKAKNVSNTILETTTNPSSITNGLIKSMGGDDNYARIHAMRTMVSDDPVKVSALQKASFNYNPFKTHYGKIASVDPQVAQTLETLTNTAYNETAELAGDFNRKAQDALIDYISPDAATKKEYEQLVLALDSNDPKLVPPTARAMEAFKKFRELTDYVASQATDAGLQVRGIMGNVRDFQAIKGYYPRGNVYGDAATFKLQQIINKATDADGTFDPAVVKEMVNKANLFGDNPGVIDSILFNYNKASNTVRTSSQRGRLYRGTLKELTDTGAKLELNPAQVFDYLNGMADSIGKARVFGKGNQALIDLQQAVGTKYIQEFPEFVESVNNATQRLATGIDTRLTSGQKLVRSINALKLGFATPVYQVAQGLSTTTDAGLLNFIKSQIDLADTDVIKRLDDYGVTNKTALNQQKRLLGLASETDTTLDKTVDLVLNKVLNIDKLDRWARLTTLVQGEKLIPKLTEAFLRNSKNTYARQFLKDVAPHLDLDAIAKSGKFSPREIRDLIRGYNDEINAVIKVGNLPEWMQSSQYSGWIQFVQPAFRQTIATKQALVRNAKAGNIKNLLVFAAVTGLGAGGINILKELQRGNVKGALNFYDEKNEANKTLGVKGLHGRILNMALSAPQLGFLGSAIQGLEYGDLSAGIVGPTVLAPLESLGQGGLKAAEAYKQFKKEGYRNVKSGRSKTTPLQKLGDALIVGSGVGLLKPLRAFTKPEFQK